MTQQEMKDVPRWVDVAIAFNSAIILARAAGYNIEGARPHAYELAQKAVAAGFAERNAEQAWMRLLGDEDIAPKDDNAT